MLDFGPFSPLLTLFITLCAAMGPIALVINWIGNRSKGLSEVQNSTVTALEAQVRAQDAQIKAFETKLNRFERILRTIQDTLRKRRRLRLEINDEYVTLIDERTSAEITVPIHTGPLERVEKEE